MKKKSIFKSEINVSSPETIKKDRASRLYWILKPIELLGFALVFMSAFLYEGYKPKFRRYHILIGFSFIGIVLLFLLIDSF